MELNGSAANAKALYRRGHARMELKDFGGAFADLREASRLEPNNRDVRAMYARCKEAEKVCSRAQDEKDRGMWARSFER